MKEIFWVVFLLSMAACSTSTPLPTETPTTEDTPPSQTATITALPSSHTLRPTLTFTPIHTPTKAPTSAVYGAPLVLVSAGEFSMGSADVEGSAEQPIHSVYLDAFYIDQYEVTNALYKDCVGAGTCLPSQSPGSSTRSSYYGNPDFDNYPVIYVDWNMAKTYCEWRGADLPTEAQWEKAARGIDGRTYPWGEGIDCDRANYGKYIDSSGNIGCPVDVPSLDSLVSYSPSIRLGISTGDTTAVGKYERGRSPYGVYDMAGNVYEWIADWYSEIYYQTSPASNPLGPDTGERRILRGGAYADTEYNLRTTTRAGDDPKVASDIYGFRCVRAANP
jgi:formylglycine-generating enzyme required for sulfatase activity